MDKSEFYSHPLISQATKLLQWAAKDFDEHKISNDNWRAEYEWWLSDLMDMKNKGTSMTESSKARWIPNIECALANLFIENGCNEYKALDYARVAVSFFKMKEPTEINDRIKKARATLLENWEDCGECASCGYHAHLNDYDISDKDIQDALENNSGIIELSCLNSDAEDSYSHRGIKFFIGEKSSPSPIAEKSSEVEIAPFQLSSYESVPSITCPKCGIKRPGEVHCVDMGCRCESPTTMTAHEMKKPNPAPMSHPPFLSEFLDPPIEELKKKEEKKGQDLKEEKTCDHLMMKATIKFDTHTVKTSASCYYCGFSEEETQCSWEKLAQEIKILIMNEKKKGGSIFDAADAVLGELLSTGQTNREKRSNLGARNIGGKSPGTATTMTFSELCCTSCDASPEECKCDEEFARKIRHQSTKLKYNADEELSVLERTLEHLVTTFGWNNKNARKIAWELREALDKYRAEHQEKDIAV